jgi:hypothetical protein
MKDKFLKKLALSIFLFSLIPCVYLFSQEEEITLTTYYPSPFGSYTQLDTIQLNINNNPTTNATGMIHFQGHNLAGNPTGGTPGSIYYNSVSGQFMYMDNFNNWRVLGGGAGTVENFTFNIVGYSDKFMGNGGIVGNRFSGTLMCDPNTYGVACGQAGNFYCGSDASCAYGHGKYHRCYQYAPSGTAYSSFSVAAFNIPVENATQNF